MLWVTGRPANQVWLQTKWGSSMIKGEFELMLFPPRLGGFCLLVKAHVCMLVAAASQHCLHTTCTIQQLPHPEAPYAISNHKPHVSAVLEDQP